MKRGVVVVTLLVVGLVSASCAARSASPEVASLGASTTTTIAAAAGSSNILPNPQQLNADEIAYAACMRSHGLPSFPDPTTSNNPHQAVGGFDISTATKDSPQYASANGACKHLLPFDGGFPSGSQLTAVTNELLKYSECMRAHGVPNFPDPTVTSHSIGFEIRGGTSSPQFGAAQRACQNLPGAP